MLKFPIILLAAFLVFLSAKGEHLFILSGQSNMRGLNPEQSFTPAVQKAFGENQCIVVHAAYSGASIQLWHKQWKDSTGAMHKHPESNGTKYDKMMIKVDSAIKGKKLDSVTFLWMQGESDAKPLQCDVYKASFLAVLEQLKKDLNVTDINYVVGRISDFGIQGKGNPDWQKVRDVLVELGTESPRGAWVDTDDLNDGMQTRGKNEPRELAKVTNDLHYTDEGYVILGQRLADKAIELINKHSKK
jgi:Carbohydrate esterase, sialic acid-specific acetylesterase